MISLEEKNMAEIIVLFLIILTKRLDNLFYGVHIASAKQINMYQQWRQIINLKTQISKNK